MLFTLQKKQKRRLKSFIVVLFGLYLMIGSALHFFQEKLLFLPTTLEQDYQYKFDYPFEELFLKTEDATINALHFKCDNPKGVILYFHGNAGDLSRWGKITEYFVTQHYDVLVMDYRTYGKSIGKLSEGVFYKDAQFCYNFLLQQQYLEENITLYGRSLGTGIASYLASANQPKQLILETPYYSILDVVEQRFPMFPVKQLLKYQFPTFKYLPKANCPITIIHGTDDKIVPYASGKKLSGLKLQNLDFKTVEGGSHNNLIEFEDYHITIKTILK